MTCCSHQPLELGGSSQQQDAPKTYSFDDPNLDSLGFLKAVRDDKTVPLALREKAARYLLPYEQNTPDQYPYSPDPLSAPPTMRHYYEG